MQGSTNQKQKIISALFLTIITFIMLSALWNGTLFPSDEEEIFLKGRAIASGMGLYTEIGSQHMPLMYYIAAFFALFGAESVPEFRLCFYLLMAILWGICYYRYGEKLGKPALVLYPIIYIILITYVEHGHTIVSEQLYGIGMAILLFELLLFQSERILKTGNCVMISLAIFISFGSAFVAIFAVFAVFSTVLCLELQTCRKNRLTIGNSILYLIQKHWKLVLIVAAPFLVLLGYYAAIGALDEFYGWAYKLNREIYPKYLNGYGGSILKSMFGGITYIADALRVGSISASSIAKLTVILVGIFFLFQQNVLYKSKILSAGLIFFFLTAATRGLFNFHGLPAIALLSAMCALYLSNELAAIRDACGKTPIKKAITIFCILVFCAPYFSKVPYLFDMTLEETFEEDSLSAALDKLTEPGERIGFGTFDYDVLINADVLPATVTSGSCPWMWEWAEMQVMEELQTALPRIYLFNPNYNTWGYHISEYAPELCALVETQYKSLAALGYPTLYIQNDHYWEAVQAIDSSIVFMAGGNQRAIPLLAGTTASQTFSVANNAEISSLGIVIGTYSRINNCTLEVTLTDETTGETIELARENCAALEDNVNNKISFEPQALDADHIYSITFSLPDANEEDFIALYCDDDSDSTAYATIDGQVQPYNLCLTIYNDLAEN